MKPAMYMIMLLFAALLPLAAAEDPLGPGHHRRVAVDNGPWTYDAFVPDIYRIDETDRYPALYLSSPNSNPGTFDLQDWAQRRGVIIISINDSKNGQTAAEQEVIQEAILAAVDKRLRLHPHLNFAAGISGGANSSLALVGRHPNKFAGILMQCMGGRPRADHFAVSWIHGAKDDVIGVRGVWRGYDAIAQSGRATIVVNRSRKHTPGSREEKEAAMEHMFWWGRLMHPRIPREEKQQYYALFNQEMVDVASLADVPERIKRCEFLAQLPNARRAPHFPELVKTWSATWLQRIEGTDDPGEKLEYLMTMGNHALAKDLDRATQQRCAELLRPLRNNQAARDHYECVMTWRELFEQEQRAGLDRNALRACQEGFAALAEKFPEHPMGKYAAGDARRLARHLGME